MKRYGILEELAEKGFVKLNGQIHLGKVRGYDALRYLSKVFNRLGYGDDVNIDYRRFTFEISDELKKTLHDW